VVAHSNDVFEHLPHDRELPQRIVRILSQREVGRSSQGPQDSA
jgi:hypothetical protein